MNQQLNISAQGGLNPKRNQALKKGLILGAVVVVGIITYRYFKKKGVYYNFSDNTNIAACSSLGHYGFNCLDPITKKFTIPMKDFQRLIIIDKY